MPSVRSRLVAANPASNFLRLVGPGQGGELVHHHLGPGRRDRAQHRVPVEGVGDHRLGPGRPQPGGLARRAGHGGHLVPVRDQQRHQPAAQGPGRPGDEDPHDQLLASASFPLRRGRRCRP